MIWKHRLSKTVQQDNNNVLGDVKTGVAAYLQQEFPHERLSRVSSTLNRVGVENPVFTRDNIEVNRLDFY